MWFKSSCSDWKDGSVVKSTHCYHRGPNLAPETPYDSSWPSLTSVPRDQTPSFGLLSSRHARNTYIGKTLIHIKKFIFKSDCFPSNLLVDHVVCNVQNKVWISQQDVGLSIFILSERSYFFLLCRTLFLPFFAFVLSQAVTLKRSVCLYW